MARDRFRRSSSSARRYRSRQDADIAGEDTLDRRFIGNFITSGFFSVGCFATAEPTVSASGQKHAAERLYLGCRRDFALTMLKLHKRVKNNRLCLRRWGNEDGTYNFVYSRRLIGWVHSRGQSFLVYFEFEKCIRVTVYKINPKGCTVVQPLHVTRRNAATA